MPVIAPIVNRPIDKHPDAVLPYEWVWTDWLTAENDHITSVDVTVEAGLTKVGSPWHSGGVVYQYIAGGTVGQIMRATCKIVTPTRTDARSLMLNITLNAAK